jgi:hypothetical protein
MPPLQNRSDPRLRDGRFNSRDCWIYSVGMIALMYTVAHI